MPKRRALGDAVSQFTKKAGESSRGETRLERLAERELAPRVRAALAGLLERTAYFEPALGLLFDEIEQHLFKQADRARSNDQQARMFEALREIKRGKADIVPRFLAHVESSIAQFDRSRVAERATIGTGNRATKLELVESSDLEISLAVQDIASKSEIRQSQPLHELAHRFGVLAGQPAFDAETMPLGPLALTSAMRYALADFDLGINERIVVFQAFDRVVMTPIAAFYDLANLYLAEQRVLPNLQLRVRRGGHESPASTANPAAPQPPPDTPQPSPPNAARPAQSGRAEPPSPAGATRAEAGAPMDADASGPSDATLFASLRELLADRRRGLGVSNSAPASSYMASRDDLQSVLGNLQSNPIEAPQQDGKSAPRSIGHLKQDLMNRLRERSPEGQAPVLALEDSDTIDLVGMLFDYIGQNLSPRSGTRELMSKLQVPVLRTALGDKDFFTRRNHPARVLLNSVAEASVLWMDDDDPDPGFVDKMTSLVDRVSRDFDGDLSLIENLLGDLSRHMNLIGKRAEMAERRHVDAAKGREKLEIARERATTAVARLVKQRKPLPIVRAVLEQAWTDVLALTILRQGEDSQNYRRRLAVADQLMRLGGDNESVALDATLRDEVRTGLTQVGLHEDEVDNIVSELFEPQKGEDKTNEAEVALTLKTKPRLGGEAAVAPPVDESVTPPPPLDADEKKMLEHVRTLPFGTWFDFVTNQQGTTVRRKLAWFSPLTGRCLFVNQRGARADERSMEQLARDLVRGQVRLFKPEATSFIDRAWNAIRSTLQQFTGDASEKTPPVPA
jgi:hypothetical protein